MIVSLCFYGKSKYIWKQLRITARLQQDFAKFHRKTRRSGIFKPFSRLNMGIRSLSKPRLLFVSFFHYESDFQIIRESEYDRNNLIQTCKICYHWGAKECNWNVANKRCRYWMSLPETLGWMRKTSTICTRQLTAMISGRFTRYCVLDVVSKSAPTRGLFLSR